MKKRMLLVLAVLISVMIFTTVSASALTNRYYTVRVYKYPNIPYNTSDYWMKEYAQQAMDEIAEAVDNGGSGYIVRPTIQGVYTHSSWSFGDNCTADATKRTDQKNNNAFGLYYAQHVLDQSGFAAKGDYVVVDEYHIADPVICGENTQTWRTTTSLAVLHEFGHMFGADEHCPTPNNHRCAMDPDDLRDAPSSSYRFCDDHEWEIYNWVKDNAGPTY